MTEAERCEMQDEGREIANQAYTLLENPPVVKGRSHRLRLVILRVNGLQFIGGDASQSMYGICYLPSC
jgi:hypothetical protein